MNKLGVRFWVGYGALILASFWSFSMLKDAVANVEMNIDTIFQVLTSLSLPLAVAVVVFLIALLIGPKKRG